MAQKKPRKTAERPKSGLYIDTHCHLLPGVDDGVGDWDEVRASLAIARRERVGHICVTPHVRPDRFPGNTPEALWKVFERFRELAGAMGIRASLGAEAYYTSDLVKAWGNGEVLPMAEAGRYLLVELPNAVMPHGLVTGLFNLRIAGVEPVLAHAERYPWAVKDPLRLGPLAQTDIPFQVTTRSVTGGFGPESQRAAFELMERGWVHIAASDAHSPRSRPPAFREAVRVLSRRYGKEAARRLCVENPRRLLAGEPLLPVSCARRGFFLR